jgi:hypothetical protein
MKRVSEMLQAASDLYEERNALYGDNYKRFGTIMVELFPEGVVITEAEDFNRFGVFVQMVSKITRYAEQFSKGGHVDSLIDTAVYATMLRELDELLRDSKFEPEPTLQDLGMKTRTAMIDACNPEESNQDGHPFMHGKSEDPSA